MALINCPECGKEISDKATTCPSCGCPIKSDDNAGVTGNGNSDSIVNTDNNRVESVSGNQGVNVKSKMPIIVGVAVAAIILIVLAIIVFPKKNSTSEETATEATTEDNSKVVYDEAVELIESGDYEEAKAKFETIPDYKDVSTILDQIPWETRAFVCIDEIKDRLKSPDSLKVYNIVFFSSEQKEDAKLDQDSIDGFKNIFDSVEEAPVVVINYGAENTMGGMTEGVMIFVYAKESQKYEYFGSAKTLDEDDAKDDEKDTVFLFNTMNDNFKRTGDVNVDRINAIIKNGVYTNVKIIDD